MTIKNRIVSILSVMAIVGLGIVSHASATAYNGFLAADVGDVQTTFTNMLAAYFPSVLALFGVTIAIRWVWRKLHGAAPK